MWRQTREQGEVIFIVHFHQEDDELNIYVDEHLENIAGNFIQFKFIQIEELTRVSVFFFRLFFSGFYFFPTKNPPGW